MKSTYKHKSSRSSSNAASRPLGDSFSLEDTFGKENESPITRVNVVSRKKKRGKKLGRVGTPRFNS